MILINNTLDLQLDKKILKCWSLGFKMEEDSMIKEFCSYTKANSSSLITTPKPNITIPEECVSNPNKIGVPDSCSFLFADTGMTDMQIGIILLVISLVILCTALIFIVKILNSMLKGKFFLNSSF